MANNEQNIQKPKESVFSALRRLFSSDVIIRNEGGGQLKVIDTDSIQTNGVIQTNALVDRFHKVYTTSTAYGVNLNLAQNYRSARVQIYADYDAMDTDAIIASALDIIADECTLKNEQGEVLQIRSSDENIQRILYNLFYSVLNIEFHLWSWIRNMCKYGDFYLKLEISEKYGVYNVIPFSAYNIAREEGFNPQNPNEVRFKFDPNAAIASTSGYSSLSNDKDESGLFFDNYEMAHFRLIGDVNYLPYGRSYLEPARKLFKQYVLIEDAMLIHRIVRAPEKRVFYVNIGAIPPGEVENFMQRMINKMKKTPLMDPQTGQYNLKYNIQNMLEDIYIPVRGNDATTRIDTAKGLDYNGIEDVQYFREKLFAALKIPKAFLGYEKDLTGKATLAAEDIRFARTIERIQRIIVSELTKIALIHLYSNGYTNESAANFTLSLTNPSIIYDQERLALFKEKVDLANQAMEKGILPRDFIYDKIFHFSEDQYSELEDQIIEDQKRAFRYKQIVEEGNDPAETGQAFGTPHQLASLYGGKGQSTLNVPTGYDETQPGEKRNPPGRPQKYNSTRGTDAATFGRDPIGRSELGSTSTSGEDEMGFSFKGGSPLALESTMAEFLKLRSTLNKINPKNVGRKTQLWEQDDSVGRGTDLFSKPEILEETTLLDDSEFPKIKRENKVNQKEEKRIDNLLEEELKKDTSSQQLSQSIDSQKETLLENSNILDDSKFSDFEFLIDKKFETMKSDIPERLLEEKNIIGEEEETMESKMDSVDNILEETGFDNFNSLIKKKFDSMREDIPERLLNENNIVSEESITHNIDTTDRTTLLREENLINENYLISLDSNFPITLLNEENIVDETQIDRLDNVFPIKLLREEKIIDENKLDKVNEKIADSLLGESKISEDSKFNITDDQFNINLLGESNIIDEKKIDEIDNKFPVTLLNEQNIVDETTIDNLDSQFPITLLREENVIEDTDKNEIDGVTSTTSLIISDETLNSPINEEIMNESNIIEGIDDEKNKKRNKKRKRNRK